MFPERGSPNSAAVSREWRPAGKDSVGDETRLSRPHALVVDDAPSRSIEERRIVAHGEDRPAEGSSKLEARAEGWVVLDAVRLGQVAERLVDEDAGLVWVEDDREEAGLDRFRLEQLAGAGDALAQLVAAVKQPREIVVSAVGEPDSLDEVFLLDGDGAGDVDDQKLVFDGRPFRVREVAMGVELVVLSDCRRDPRLLENERVVVFHQSLFLSEREPPGVVLGRGGKGSPLNRRRRESEGAVAVAGCQASGRGGRLREGVCVLEPAERCDRLPAGGVGAQVSATG